MTEKEWIKRLQSEGYSDVRVCPIEPGEDPEHTHDLHTLNVILEGELTITDKSGTKTYRSGDRVETTAGTTHKAKNGPTVGKMIVGYKK